MTRFFNTALPTTGNMELELELPGVDGVVSYSTAIRLNLRLRRVFGLQNNKNKENTNINIIGWSEFVSSIKCTLNSPRRTEILVQRIRLKIAKQTRLSNAQCQLKILPIVRITLY